MTAGIWRLRDGVLDLATPRVVGILNVTPDSFSDGGRWHDPRRALEHARKLVEAGADMLDVGGESTRPGAREVTAAEEIDRVMPVLERIRADLPVLISVDTRKAEVARAALAAGADAINDVSALADPAMAETVASAGAGLVLMHMRGTPQTMQQNPRYDDVAGEVASELGAALAAAAAGGIERDRLVVDPGIGFAKTAEHNLELLARLDTVADLGVPVMLGPSRKAFLGHILGGAPPEGRDVATAAVCALALRRGVRIFRVHNPAVTREALLVADAILRVEAAAA